MSVQFFGTLATYRFFFTAHQGVEANYGYSRSTTSYNFATGQSGVNANQHEWTGAYLYRFPLGRIAPFIEVGVGGLTFQPVRLHANPCGICIRRWRRSKPHSPPVCPGPVSWLRLQQSDVRRNGEYRRCQGGASCGAFYWTRPAALNRIT